MKKSKKSFGSIFSEFLVNDCIPFEVYQSAPDRTFFKLSGVLSNISLSSLSVKIPYWQILPFDSTSYLFVVFEEF